MHDDDRDMIDINEENMINDVFMSNGGEHVHNELNKYIHRDDNQLNRHVHKNDDVIWGKYNEDYALIRGYEMKNKDNTIIWDVYDNVMDDILDRFDEEVIKNYLCIRDYDRFRIYKHDSEKENKNDHEEKGSDHNSVNRRVNCGVYEDYNCIDEGHICNIWLDHVEKNINVFNENNRIDEEDNVNKGRGSNENRPNVHDIHAHPTFSFTSGHFTLE